MDSVRFDSAADPAARFSAIDRLHLTAYERMRAGLKMDQGLTASGFHDFEQGREHSGDMLLGRVRVGDRDVVGPQTEDDRLVRELSQPRLGGRVETQLNRAIARF